MSPTIAVSPQPSMADSEVDIQIHGELDLSKHESLAGTYRGVDKMGLFWSMESSPNNKTRFVRFLVKDVTKPKLVTIRVYDKTFDSVHDLISDNDASIVAKCQVTQLYMQPGMKRVEVDENDVKGTLFFPPGKGPFPGVIYILGAMANPLEADSALLASHGFATFNVKYFGFENWTFHIRMEMFERAVQLLRNHKDVMGDQGVSVLGLCKGGQFALCMAECLQGVKSVVAINSPIMPVHNSHQFHGKVWPCVENEELGYRKINKHGGLISRNGFPMITDADEETLSDAIFKFYNRHDVPCLLLASLNDEDVPSEHYYNHAEKLLRKAKHPDFTVIRYQGTGHLLEPAYTPFCIRSSSNLAMFLEWGGTKIPHSRAQIDSWKTIIKFLNRTSGMPACKL